MVDLQKPKEINFLFNIFFSKENPMEENGIIDREVEKTYSQFIVNRFMSYHLDTIHLAEQLNRMPTIRNIDHFRFLLNNVRKLKRKIGKWRRAENLDDIGIIREYFDYNYRKAKIAISILSEDEMNVIRNKIKIKRGKV